MSEVTEQTINEALKPFDVVECNETGSVGIISEVSVNESQDNPYWQIQYSVKWLTGEQEKSAWFGKCDIEKSCNLFQVIAELSCHPMGQNEKWVKKLINL